MKYAITLLLVLFISSCQSTKQQENVTPSTNKQMAQTPSKSLTKSQLFLGTEDYFELLNLNYPGLEQVKKAVESAEFDLAKYELRQYYRQRFQKPKTEKITEADQNWADLALKKIFPGNKSNPEAARSLNNDIDWFSKAVIDGETIHDAEWLFQFHRFRWWPSLARVYNSTQDPRYFKEWELEVNSYIKNIFPIHNNNTPWFIRRGMECENRNRNLIYALPYFIHSDLFSADLLLNILYMQHHQTEQIRKVYAKKGNHLLADLDGVLAGATSFPEFKNAEEWTQEVLDMYPGLMFSEIYEDGMNKELVFSYHLMYINLFTKFYNKLEELGLDERLPASFHERLAKMYEIFVHQSYPDMTYCQFGDGWKKSPGTVRRMIQKHHMKKYPNNSFYQFIVSDGKQGQGPKSNSKAYPQSGFYFLRSGFSKNDIFMPVKANHTAGAWHNQIDNGTFGLYAYGRNFMNDSGSYIYNSDDPKDQAWRQWFRSSVAHQTMTLDGKDIDLKAKMINWQDQKDLTYLEIENQSYPKLKHRRSVYFVDQSYFIIHDRALGDAEGDLRVHFQLVPSQTQFTKNSVNTQFQSGANLHIHHLKLDKATEIIKEKGFISYVQKKMEARPAWALRTHKKANDTPEFITILEPLNEGQKSSVFEIDIQLDKGETSLKIKRNGQHKQISINRKVLMVQAQP